MSGKAGGFRGKSDKGSKGSKSARPHAGNRGGKLHRHGRGERPNALNVFQTGDDVQELSDDGITNLGSSKAKFQDEDIDEDDAFDEEDYKKYGALMSKGKSKGKKPAQGKAAKRSQQEIDDENEDLDGEELPGGMSLSDMLDGDDGISEDDEVPAKRSKYDESDDDEAADNLISSIGKATASSTAAVKRKRLQAAEQTELVPEAEFNLRMFCLAFVSLFFIKRCSI
jgi:U3 small nucleolar RNA-associated protein 14